MRIKQFVAYALLLLIAAGAQPAYSAFWQWSKTAASNATADPTINWAEGMSPSSVNDSARAQMAREAEQRDDQSGSLTTGGTSTAYTVTSNQGMCLSPSVTPQTGQSIAMTMHATNGASPTLGVDSCTVYPIQSGGAALAAGILIANNPYSFKFNGSAWILINRYSAGIAVVKKQIFTASGTYTPSAGLVSALIECVGPGGGGGGAVGATGGSNSGGGGGGGNTSRVLVTAATVGGSQTVTIGAGGAGGAAGFNSGLNGSPDTSVGTLCVGKAGAGAAAASTTSNAAAGGAGGAAGTGDFTVPGQRGGGGVAISVTSTTPVPSGNGGNAGLGFGAGGVTASLINVGVATGVNGSNYGGGGSGGLYYNTATNVAGGNGANGIVVITEYTSQ